MKNRKKLMSGIVGVLFLVACGGSAEEQNSTSESAQNDTTQSEEIVYNTTSDLKPETIRGKVILDGHYAPEIDGYVGILVATEGNSVYPPGKGGMNVTAADAQKLNKGDIASFNITWDGSSGMLTAVVQSYELLPADTQLEIPADQLIIE